MQIIQDNISIPELKKMSGKMFNNLVKAVVDIEKEIMVVDAEFYADQEELLLENGSEQANLWGINIHPDEYPEGDWIEFDSIINIRPSQQNNSITIENFNTRNLIVAIINKLVTT